MTKLLSGCALVLLLATGAYGYFTLYRIPQDVLTGKSGGSRSTTPIAELLRQYQSGRGVIAP